MVEKPNQVLVAVKAVGICGSDMATYIGAPTRKLPLVPCHEVAGEVRRIGSGVKRFSIGDRVVIQPMLTCGKCYACKCGRSNVCRELKTIGSHCDGAAQEYIVTTEDKLYRIPDCMNYIQATLIEPFTIAAQVNTRLRVKAGEKLLVYGAGPIGLAIMLVAKSMGAFVAVSEVSEGRLEFARKFGADRLINPNKVNLKKEVLDFTGGKGPDVIIDSAGIPSIETQAVELANYGGRIGNICFAQKEISVDVGRLVSKRLTISGSRLQTHQFSRVIEEYSDVILRSEEMITDIFPFERACEAFELFGNKKDTTGKIIITFPAQSEVK